MTISLQEISDRLEIQDIIVEYADIIDSCEIDRLAIFLPRMPLLIIQRWAANKGSAATIRGQFT